MVLRICEQLRLNGCGKNALRLKFAKQHGFAAVPSKRPLVVPRTIRGGGICQLRCQLPLCPRGALGAPAPVLHGKKSFKCYSLVGADDSVGPLGSYGFAAVFRKIGASRRVDVGIDPYNWRSA